MRISIGRAAVALARSFFMRRIFLLAAPLLLASCATMFTPRTQHASSAAKTIPDMPMQKWGIESCGAGSLSTVLQHYGDTTSMKQWDTSLPKTRGGVMTIDMLIDRKSVV